MLLPSNLNEMGSEGRTGKAAAWIHCRYTQPRLQQLLGMFFALHSTPFAPQQEICVHMSKVVLADRIHFLSVTQ
jgi:hypothetical protein